MMKWSRILFIGKMSLTSFFVMSSVNLFVAREYGAVERGNLTKFTLFLIAVQFLSEGGILGAVAHSANNLSVKFKLLNGFVRWYIFSRLLIFSILLSLPFCFFLEWLTFGEAFVLITSQIIAVWYQANSYILQGVNLEIWNRINLGQSIFYAITVFPIVFNNLPIVYVLVTFNISFFITGFVARIILIRRGQANLSELTFEEKLELRKYSKKNFYWVSANQLMSRIDLLIISVLLQNGDLGIYSVALSLSMIMSPIFSTIGNIGFIEGSSKSQHELKNYLSDMSRKYLSLASILLVPVILIGVIISELFLGDDYSSITKVIPVTSVVVIVKLQIQSIAQVLRSAVHMREATYVQLYYCAMLIVFTPFVYGLFGTFGSILIAITSASMLYSCCLMLYIKRRI